MGHERSINTSPILLNGSSPRESRPCALPGKYSRDGSEGKGMDATVLRVQELESCLSLSQAASLGKVGQEPSLGHTGNASGGIGVDEPTPMA